MNLWNTKSRSAGARGLGVRYAANNTIRISTLFGLLICTTSLTGGCAAKGLIAAFSPMNEGKAIMELAKMLPDRNVSEITVEWTKTDPKADAPNSLTYDNYTFALTYKTPAGTTVYGPVQRRTIEQLAARAEAGEEVKIFDVTKSGAKILGRPKDNGAKTF